MKLKFLVAFACIAAFCTSFNPIVAQQAQLSRGCGLSGYMEKLLAEHPEMLTQLEQFQAYQADFIKKAKANAKVGSTPIGQPKIIIPIVFHIIHNYGTENISDAQILNEMDTLNRDYQKQNRDTILLEPPFNKIAANCNIEWRLAQIDPYGKPTTGIERIPSVKTYNAGEGSKINQWPRQKYMNVWVVSSIASGDGLSGGTILGYAPFPSSVDGYYYPSDGVLINNIGVGSIGTAGGNLASYPTEFSRTLTHELGHTMSLLHTWGPTNSPGVACGDDGIADTPPTEGHFSCSSPADGLCGADTLVNLFSFSGVTPNTGNSDKNTPLPKNVNNEDTTVVLLSFTPFNAHGVDTASSIAGQFAFAKWDTSVSQSGSLDTGKYYQVVVKPAYAYSTALIKATFQVRPFAKSVSNFAVRSSADGFAANLTATIAKNNYISIGNANTFNVVRDTTAAFNCTVTMPSFIYQPLTLRFYGWNAADSTGLFAIDSVQLTTSTGLTENVQNYMEYSTCQKMFTNDQALAIRATLNADVSNRDSLWTQTNLLATGTADPYVYAPKANPVADFHSNNNLANTDVAYTVPVPNILTACKSSTVYFFNDAWGATKFDSARWTFQNGTPSTLKTNGTPSYDTLYRNYVPVTFNAAGAQNVTLTVYADTGSGQNKGVVSSSVTKTVFVTDTASPQISSIGGSHFFEGFEDTASFRKNWIVNNVSNNATYWAVTNQAAASGYNCAELNAYWTPNQFMPFDNNIGDVDELISPTMNLANFDTAGNTASAMWLTFNYSYATRSFEPSQVLDFFDVWYSTSCGETWTKLGALTPNNDSIAQLNGAHSASYAYLGDPAFANAGIDGNSFVPLSNSSAYWKQVGFQLPILCHTKTRLPKSS